MHHAQCTILLVHWQSRIYIYMYWYENVQWRKPDDELRLVHYELFESSHAQHFHFLLGEETPVATTKIFFVNPANWNTVEFLRHDSQGSRIYGGRYDSYRCGFRFPPDSYRSHLHILWHLHAPRHLPTLRRRQSAANHGRWHSCQDTHDKPSSLRNLDEWACWQVLHRFCGEAHQWCCGRDVPQDKYAQDKHP